MVQMKLDCISADQLDLENYIYRWVNDDPGRIRMVHQQDDYDFVNVAEIGENFDPDKTDSESAERVRMFAGKDGQGNATYTYLMRKPRAYWQEDYNEVMDARQAQMEGRVYRAEIDEDDQAKGADPDIVYAPQGNRIGHGGERRRGPVPSKLK